MYTFSKILSVTASACALASIAQAAITADKISSIPGFNGKLPSNQYSGYLDVGNGKNLFYWFVESENKPSADPVVLWLNGGPGCSSMDGFFHEHGPFEISSDGGAQTLNLRTTRWNKIANMLYIDAPAGVGLSYSTNPRGLIHNDSSTAADNLEALTEFFEGFPEFQSNDFYITGESYAGIYVPTLAFAIHKSNKQGNNLHLNLKGIMVGNGCIGTEVGTCSNHYASMYHSEYLYRMGLYSDDLHTTITSACGDWSKSQRKSAACKAALTEMHLEVGPVDIYDVYGPCINSGQADADDDATDDDIASQRLPTYRRRPITEDEQEILAAAQLRAKTQGLPPSGPIECFNTGAIESYLDRVDVRNAIHAAPLSVTGNWTICTGKITYTSTEPNEPRDIYPTLIQNYRVTIYNGDADACIPFVDNEDWTSGMGIPIAYSWRPWYYNQQVGGYVTEYQNKFKFVIVKGAGHMVPQIKPNLGYALFSRYIFDEPM